MDHLHHDHDDFGGLHRDLTAKAPSDAVYALSSYTGSASNLSRISLATDGIFSDGSALELATVTGSVDSGYTATLGGYLTGKSAKAVDFLRGCC